MTNTWLVIIPPFIVLILGFFTRRVLLSLICGILFAAIIATNGAPIEALNLALRYLWDNLEIAKYSSWSSILTAKNSFIALFLCMLGAIVTLIQYSGGAHAYGTFVKGRLNNARSAEIASLLLSSLIFVDDYFSTLTCGTVMRPLTDRYRVPRVKLAFLVNAMAAPLVILAPISSWVAAIIGFLGENGVSLIATNSTIILADPFLVYTKILPFIFYSVIMISCAWFIVIKRISFGLIGTHERIALTTGNLLGGAIAEQPVTSKHDARESSSSLIDFIVPIVTLFCSVLGAIQYTGNSWLFGGTARIIDAFRNANPYQGLLLAGIITLAIIIPFYLVRRKITLQHIPHVAWEGAAMMLPAIVMLMLAWTLGDILRINLQTGVYLAHLMHGFASLTFLPLLFFVLSAATSMAIGTSWGTAAIMFPIAIPMVVSYIGAPVPITIDQATMLLPVLGGVLAGAVAGNHLSPIADTTIMSSTSTGARHADLVQGQMTYAAPIFFSTCCAFLTCGFLAQYGTYVMIFGSLAVGLCFSFLLLLLLSKRNKS